MPDKLCILRNWILGVLYYRLDGISFVRLAYMIFKYIQRNVQYIQRKIGMQHNFRKNNVCL